MFTGIIESQGRVEEISWKGSNYIIRISSSISDELKVDQSLSHDGVCLTVTEIRSGVHTVVAVSETLAKTNLKEWTVGSLVNLERAMPANGRFDGHIVQGHVDGTAVCESVIDLHGSWEYRFRLQTEEGNTLVEKGSVCLNGISLTVFDVHDDAFSIAVIPYTYEHTNIHNLTAGSTVNIEFDVIGKYVAKLLQKQAG